MGLRPLGYCSLPPSHPYPAGGKASKVHWLLVLWVGSPEASCHALSDILPKNTHPEAPGLGPRACTHLPGSPQLESRERVQEAVHPHPQEEGGAGPGGRFQRRERVAGIGQKNLGGSTRLLGSRANIQPPPFSLTGRNSHQLLGLTINSGFYCSRRQFQQ